MVKISGFFLRGLFKRSLAAQRRTDKQEWIKGKATILHMSNSVTGDFIHQQTEIAQMGNIQIQATSKPRLWHSLQRSSKFERGNNKSLGNRQKDQMLKGRWEKLNY